MRPTFCLFLFFPSPSLSPLHRFFSPPSYLHGTFTSCLRPRPRLDCGCAKRRSAWYFENLFRASAYCKSIPNTKQTSTKNPKRYSMAQTIPSVNESRTKKLSSCLCSLEHVTFLSSHCSRDTYLLFSFEHKFW